MTTPIYFWETEVIGTTLSEIEANAGDAIYAFFGHHRGYTLNITPGEMLSVRDGGGTVVGHQVAYYTAKVRCRM